MNEYDLYIRSFGASNTIQAFTQYNEDNIDRDVQTEDWDIEDKWTQAPPEDLKESDSSVSNLPWIHNEKTRQKNGKKVFHLANVESMKLVKFLQRSSQVMEMLLEENTVESGVSGENGQVTTMPFAHGHVRVLVPEFFNGRIFEKAVYSPSDPRIVLTLLSKPMQGSMGGYWGTRGVLCLWRLTEPKHPYRILTCEAQPTSFCFSKPNLIFAGTLDGSIVAWNLLDRERLGEELNIYNCSLVIQRPSYATDGLYSVSRIHQGSIRSIWSVDAQTKAGGGLGTNNDAHVIQQICSIDEFGWIQFWTVVEVEESNRDTIDFDLGMAIGSSIRIVKGSGFQSKKIPSSLCTFLAPETSVTDCKADPHNPEAFLIGTEFGVILHESQFQNHVFPRSFQKHRSYDLPMGAITGIDFNPYEKDVFLASLEDGMIGIFHKKEIEPLTQFQLPSMEIQSFCWSSHRPSVFYVLSTHGQLSVWDLTESDRVPYSQVDLPKSIYSHITSSPSIQHIHEGKNRSSANLQSSHTSLNTSSHHASIAITHEKGLDVYVLNSTLGDFAVGEEEAMIEYISKFIFCEKYDE